MVLHPDDLEEQMRDGQVVTTMLDAVPLVLEASSHPCGVCVTLQSGVGMSKEGKGFGLIVIRVDARLDDLCAHLGYAASDLTWRSSVLTVPEEAMLAHPSPDSAHNTGVNACASFGLSIIH